VEAVAAVVAGCAFVAGVLAVATWGDGDPGPWIWISLACAPLGFVGGIAAVVSRGGRVALGAVAVSAVVSAFWLFVIIFLLTSQT
jgi:hypothetical protein